MASMTTESAVLFLACFLMLLVGIGLIWQALFGPDPDLEAPWSPADPEPGPLRRPCLDASCPHNKYDEITESEKRALWGDR